MVLDLTKKYKRADTAVSASSSKKSETSLPRARDSVNEMMFFIGGMIVARDAAAESSEVSASVHFLIGVFLRRRISYSAIWSGLLLWLIIFLSPIVMMGAFRFPKMLTLTSLAVDAVGCPHSEQKREAMEI